MSEVVLRIHAHKFYRRIFENWLVSPVVDMGLSICCACVTIPTSPKAIVCPGINLTDLPKKNMRPLEGTSVKYPGLSIRSSA
jgi:hypothetical protein